MATDNGFFVTAHDGIRLAVRDLGGDGPDMVLMHGAGTHLLSLGYLAGQLEGYRIVTMDARWSGQSGDSDEYSWDDLVRDVESVSAAAGLDNPIVAGHSWGGIIAAFYGRAHPDAPAVVNLDGHGSGSPAMYDGISEEDAAAGLEMLERFATPAAASANSGDAAWLAEARKQALNDPALMGMRDALKEPFVDRQFVDRGDGTWLRHPSPVLYSGLRGDLGLFDVYRAVDCPLQIFNCTKQPDFLPPPVTDLLSAYRRGLTKALDGLAAQRPNVCVVHRDDVDHGGIAMTGAKAIADDVMRFLAEVGAGPSPHG